MSAALDTGTYVPLPIHGHISVMRHGPLDTEAGQCANISPDSGGLEKAGLFLLRDIAS